MEPNDAESLLPLFGLAVPLDLIGPRGASRQPVREAGEHGFGDDRGHPRHAPSLQPFLAIQIQLVR
jgi:hypothetical protein